MNRLELGVGFNPGFMRGWVPPAEATYLEAGAHILLRPEPLPFLEGRNCSLHLARAPFCEPPELQDLYVRGLIAAIADTPLTSVGIHLCGPYTEGLGRFGFGSGFSMTHRARAERLIQALTDALPAPLWLENATYYQTEPEALFRTAEFMNQVSHKYGVGQILDLSHCLMASQNAGLNAAFLLGRVALEHVRVVHLSGVIEDARGAMHDGHTEPVHPQVWALLQQAAPLLAPGTRLVLEHTEPVWAEKLSRFAEDWAQVLPYQQGGAFHGPPDVDEIQAAIGYMTNVIIPQRMGPVAEVLGRAALRAQVAAWAPTFFAKTAQMGAIVSFQGRDFFGPTVPQLDPLQDFAEFLRGRLAGS